MVSSSPVQSRLRYHLSNLRDPRHTRTRRYLLCDILLIVLCGLLSGADNFVSIAQWAEAKKDWLQEALGVAALPSHDTLGRVLSRLDADALNHCLLNWSQSLWTPEAGAVVAFDGKRLRGAMGNLTLLSAFATKTRLTLSVQKVAEGSNEIPALREALALLSLEGCVVTASPPTLCTAKWKRRKPSWTNKPITYLPSSVTRTSCSRRRGSTSPFGGASSSQVTVGQRFRTSSRKA